MAYEDTVQMAGKLKFEFRTKTNKHVHIHTLRNEPSFGALTRSDTYLNKQFTMKIFLSDEKNEYP